MKTIFLILIFIAHTTFCTGQNKNLFLLASRNNVDKEYKINTRFLIKYYSSGTTLVNTKGYFKGAYNDSTVLFTATLKSKDSFAVPLQNILYLRKIKSKARERYAIGFGTMAISGALLANTLSNNKDTIQRKENFNYIFAIPIIGVGLYCLYAIPATIIFEIFNEHKKINNWSFHLLYRY